MKTIVVTRVESDALRDQALARLSGVDDVFHAVQAGDFVTAERLGIEFLDLLTLLGQLGWKDVGGEGDVGLEMPAEQLRRLFRRLLADAESLCKAEEQEASEACQGIALARGRTAQVVATARRIVAQASAARQT